MRKILFWSHLAAGVTAGLIVVVMSFTGVLLAFEKQCVAWFERGSFRLPEPGSAMPLEELLRPVAKPNATIVLRSDPHEPVEFSAGRAGPVYLDPQTGRELGKPAPGSRQVFQKITAWHRYLGTEGPGRATGKLITGVCNLAFLFMVLSGVYLWLPRKWTWQHLRPVVWFRGGLAGKARDFNWHNTLGVWCLIPLAVVVAGAVPISFAWGNELVYKITGSPNVPPAPQPKPASEVSLAGLDALLGRAKSQRPDWKIISFRLPASGEAPVTFTVDWGTGAQPQKRGNLTLSRDGSSKWEGWEDNNTGRKLRLWLRFLHTGEALGLAGQAIAAVASGCAVVLGYTGFMLAWRRFVAWRRR
jgi:uncharacterized iron-regulated membrane protein